MAFTVTFPDGSVLELNGYADLGPGGVVTPPSGRNDEQIVPPMTGAASPAGYSASATSEYTEAGFTAAAWRAFDGIFGTDWHSCWSSAVGAPQTLSVRLPVAKTCYSYKIRRRGDLAGLAPTSWALKDRAGNVLHSVSGFAWGSNVETPYFDVTTPISDSGFDLVVGAASGSLCQIDGVELRS